jgi:hypothetical protein
VVFGDPDQLSLFTPSTADMRPVLVDLPRAHSMNQAL